MYIQCIAIYGITTPIFDQLIVCHLGRHSLVPNGINVLMF